MMFLEMSLRIWEVLLAPNVFLNEADSLNNEKESIANID